MFTPRLGIRTTLRRVIGTQGLETASRELKDLKREVEQLDRVVAVLAQKQHANLPLPPDELRLHVGMRTSAANFLAQGSNSSERVLQVFGESPRKPVLDWGCGSGRTLRWLMDYPGWRDRYHGCDVDAAAIAWLKQNTAANVLLCDDEPPLPYPDGTFGGLFAFSVLTHIHPEKHRGWYVELRRVLEPGGVAYLTTQGPTVVENPVYGISESAKREFSATGCTYVEGAGHYKSAALVSEDYTRRMLGGLFAIEDYQRDGYQNMDAFLVRAVA
jgi:SAM-dependent methyltransferase